MDYTLKYSIFWENLWTQVEIDKVVKSKDLVMEKDFVPLTFLYWESVGCKGCLKNRDCKVNNTAFAFVKLSLQ